MVVVATPLASSWARLTTPHCLAAIDAITRSAPATADSASSVRELGDWDRIRTLSPDTQAAPPRDGGYVRARRAAGPTCLRSRRTRRPNRASPDRPARR